MSKMKVALMIKISGETAKKRLNMWEGGEITNSAFISPVFKITELLTECQIFLDGLKSKSGAHLTAPLRTIEAYRERNGFLWPFVIGKAKQKKNIFFLIV